MLQWWSALSLARQFLLAGITVSLLTMAAVGVLVTDLIERTFIKHTAAGTALFVDSVIAPIMPDMRTTRQIDGIVAQILDETLSAGKLGERLVSFRLWRGDGTVLYSSRPELLGRRVAPSDNLKRAFSGEIVAEYVAENSLGEPLLKIYSPILQPWTGEAVAVSEFHEIVPDLAEEIWSARTKGWAAVVLVTLGLFLTLAAIVFRGSSTIEAQRIALRQRIDDLAQLAARNELLAIKAQDASQRATAFNERFLRQLGADLHDGPAQMIALAALRLGSRPFRNFECISKERDTEVAVIRANLAAAMEEIRLIASGLAVPHVEAADLKEVIAAAVASRADRVSANINLETSQAAPILSTEVKICVFRFLQEALANAVRHGGPNCNISIYQRYEDRRLVVEVIDDGPGFDISKVGSDRLGLTCLQQRVEGVGGRLDIVSSRLGTRLTMVLKIEEIERSRWAA